MNGLMLLSGPVDPLARGGSAGASAPAASSPLTTPLDRRFTGKELTDPIHSVNY